MPLHLIHPLLFSLVTSESLILECTGWRRSDIDNSKQIKKPATDHLVAEHGNSNKKFSISDRRAVSLTFILLRSLDRDSLQAKLEQVKKNIQKNSPFIPNTLSQNHLDLWAKNTQWKRHEAALLSLGFILDNGCRKPFETTMFYDQQYEGGDFNQKHFSLFKAFRERDQLLRACIESS